MKFLKILRSKWWDSLPIVLGGLIFGFQLWQLAGILIVLWLFVLAVRYLVK